MNGIHYTPIYICMYVIYVSIHSTIIPERLDAFVNKYAEHTHDKWAFEKVSYEKCKQ